MVTRLRPWTEVDDIKLLALVTEGKLSNDEIAQRLGRTGPAVTARIHLLRAGNVVNEYRRKDSRCKWTPDQDSLLLLHYGSMDPEELARLVDKSPKSLRNRVSRLRRGRPVYNVEHLNAGSTVVPDPTPVINRFLTPDYITQPHTWSPYDDMRLRLFYGDLSLPNLAALLGRTVDACKARLAQLHWSLDQAIAFRFEAARSPLWVDAIQALRRAPYESKRAAAAAQVLLLTDHIRQLQRVQTRGDAVALTTMWQAALDRVRRQLDQIKEYMP